MYAARFNDNPDVTSALLGGGAEVDARTENGWTALISTAQSNDDSAVIALLLEAGADVNAKTYLYESTALMEAAKLNGNPGVIEMLLGAGADAKAKDNAGKMAIDYARENENLADTDALRALQSASN
jgi:ankyrin repeat protein